MPVVPYSKVDVQKIVCLLICVFVTVMDRPTDMAHDVSGGVVEDESAPRASMSVR